MSRTMNAVDRIRAKLSSCVAACLGFPNEDNMAGDAVGGPKEGKIRSRAVSQ